MAENGSSNNPSEVMRGFCGNTNYNFYLDKATTCLTSIVLEAIKLEGLILLDDMSGHPGMTYYMEQGYEVITF